MRKVSDEKIGELANYLEGSCNSLDEAINRVLDLEFEDLEIDDLMELDDKVFCCEVCGWWSPLHDLSEGSIEDQCTLVCIECEEENN